MPSQYRPDLRSRAPAALAAAAVQVGLAVLLITGLAGQMADAVEQRLEVTSLPARPEPEPTAEPSPQPTPKPGDTGDAPAKAAGAAGKRAEPTQIVAPTPPIILTPPPPVVTASVAGVGDQASAGAADAGFGPGAGGVGSGPGGGGSGGSGGTGGGGRGAERIAGGLRDSDYPAAARHLQASGTVFIRIRVGTDGRVRGCEITRSSGTPLLDETTCRLVQKRFRYRPAVDAAGQRIESVETTNFTWGTRER